MKKIFEAAVIGIMLLSSSTAFAANNVSRKAVNKGSNM